MERYACQFSLTIVALGGIGFVAEVFHALEYIKGNPIIWIRVVPVRINSCSMIRIGSKKIKIDPPRHDCASW